VSVEPGVPELSGRVLHAPTIEVRREPGVIEGEALTVESKTGGEVLIQGMEQWGPTWSGAAQLWWLKPAEGDVLTLALPVARDGEYDLAAAFTRAPDYGTIEVAVDGRVVGGPIDLYAEKVEHSGVVPLGRLALTAGARALTIRVTGKAPASRGHLAGIDWIRMEPAAGPR
jgi:hypothetical protein